MTNWRYADYLSVLDENVSKMNELLEGCKEIFKSNENFLGGCKEGGFEKIGTEGERA